MELYHYSLSIIQGPSSRCNQGRACLCEAESGPLPYPTFLDSIRKRALHGFTAKVRPEQQTPVPQTHTGPTEHNSVAIDKSRNHPRLPFHSKWFLLYIVRKSILLWYFLCALKCQSGRGRKHFAAAMHHLEPPARRRARSSV